MAPLNNAPSKSSNSSICVKTRFFFRCRKATYVKKIYFFVGSEGRSNAKIKFFVGLRVVRTRKKISRNNRGSFAREKKFPVTIEGRSHEKKNFP